MAGGMYQISGNR